VCKNEVKKFLKVGLKMKTVIVKRKNYKFVAKKTTI